ncbi:hypothetical protein TNCV_1393611 [Trichonephila clavipes]|nr:hypothetical protein TNCV_1393611 [Trichonephila clavipes]
MGHENQYRSRKRKFTGNQYKNKRSSIDSQAENDTTVASLGFLGYQVLLRVIGKGFTAGNKLFGMLDLPFLSKTAFRNQELKLQQAACIVSIESMKNAATEVKKLKIHP